jgi:hypothetical protein
VVTHAGGRLSPRHLDVVVWLMAAALLVRAVLGLADAIALAGGGVRALPVGAGMGLGATSPLWSALLALLALAGGVGLIVWWPTGWLIALGACLGYLLSGLGDLAFVASVAAFDPSDYVVLFAGNVAMPIVVIAGLLWARSAFLHRARQGARPAVPPVVSPVVPPVVSPVVGDPRKPPAR